jgi:hypothetical protein
MLSGTTNHLSRKPAAMLEWHRDTFGDRVFNERRGVADNRRQR